MAANQNTKPSMKVRLHSQFCDMAERDGLEPGMPAPRETYPKYYFGPITVFQVGEPPYGREVRRMTGE